MSRPGIITLGSSFAIALLVLFGSHNVHAEDTHQCVAASDEGQKLRDDHKLAAARDRFAVCARDSCPSLIRRTCQDWLAEVTLEQPTVVLGVRDAEGHDVLGVRVLVDGARVTSALDGSPLTLDPGPHVLRFEAAGFIASEQTVLARQGEKNREVTTVLSPVAPVVPLIVAPVVPRAGSVRASAGSPVFTASGATSSADAGGHRSRAWSATGWALAGAGLVGLGVGTVFGVLAVVDNNHADCNALRQCASGPLSEARTAAVGADVALIAGGVLLATGVTLVLVNPKSSSASAAAHVSPIVGGGRAGLALGASF